MQWWDLSQGYNELLKKFQAKDQFGCSNEVGLLKKVASYV